MKAIVRYRDDQDLENVIDFVQKKVKETYFCYVAGCLHCNKQSVKNENFL